MASGRLGTPDKLILLSSQIGLQLPLPVQREYMNSTSTMHHVPVHNIFMTLEAWLFGCIQPRWPFSFELLQHLYLTL